MRILVTRLTTSLATCAVLAAATPVARADFTPVHDPRGSELDHLSIFADYYSPGTPWHTTGSRVDSRGNVVDFTNGLLSATRVDDWGYGNVLDLQAPFLGQVDDQSFTAEDLSVKGVARFAGYTQEFGYDLEGDAEGYIKLFKLSGNNMSVNGDVTLSLAPSQSFDFLRDGNKGGQWSSDPAANSDGRDHLVTYSVSGLNDGLAHWMLFWEDLPNGGDSDYNDLVAEVTTVVPEPGMGLTITLAAGVLLCLRRRPL